MALVADEAPSDSLHTDGCISIPIVPDWAPLAFSESIYAKWGDIIVAELEKCKHLWPAESSGTRPGERAAAHVNAALAALGADGVWVTTTHPSVDEHGAKAPRWYASVVEAAWRKGTGCVDANGELPHPPQWLSRLLWPDKGEELRPWLTELGWTMCPPQSAPQAIHADIGKAPAHTLPCRNPLSRLCIPVRFPCIPVRFAPLYSG